MRLDSASFQDFPPFADGLIKFPPKPEGSTKAEVHFLTGPNGCGKTRMLCLLAAALGNESELARRLGDKKSHLAVGGFSDDGQWGGWFRNQGVRWISGNDEPADGYASLITDPQDSERLPRRGGRKSPNFLNDSITGVQACGAFAFDASTPAQDAKVLPMKEVNLGNPSEHLLFTKPDTESAVVAQSLTNIKMGAAMEQMQRLNGEGGRLIKLADRLEGALSSITGRPFGFIVDPQPTVALKAVWGGVKMRFEELPNGLRSIIGNLAAVAGKLASAYPDHPDPLSLPIVLLLDEPEAHLHPGWQRHVVRAAQELLPNAQIFAATHSAFAISSVNEGWIHIMRPGDDGLVHIEEPRACSNGDSYLEVLQEVLGLTERFDPDTEEQLKQYRELRQEVLNGAWTKEAELRALAQAIGDRGPSLQHMMGQELWQLDKIKAQSRAS
ncbi:MAG: AAA family ATPase [Verrucomicrobiales bacterium]